VNDENAFKSFFVKYGVIEEFTIIRDKIYGHHKGCAFLTYSTKEETLRAISELNEKFIYPGCSSALQLRPADVRPEEREYKLFVGMVPKKVDDSTLLALFAELGDLKELHLIRGPDGQSKGCAFVKYFNQEAATRAIEVLNGRVLEVLLPIPIILYLHLYLPR
jgi:CUG-BP- and ETR3-like factor